VSGTRAVDGAPAGGWLNLLGVVLLSAGAALAGALEVFLVPLRLGSVLVPIAVVGALVGNRALPRLARWLIDTTTASVAPFVCWLVPVFVLAMTPRPEGDVLIRSGGGEQWVFYGVLLGGALVGGVTIVLLSGPARPPMRQPPAGSSR
jgi:hypothetical protein